MFTRTFWVATLERGLKTFGQAFAAVLTAGATGLLDVGWIQALSVAGLATVVSVATSLGSARISGDDDSPSLVSDQR
jgi:hypothetical protein